MVYFQGGKCFSQTREAKNTKNHQCIKTASTTSEIKVLLTVEDAVAQQEEP